MPVANNELLKDVITVKTVLNRIDTSVEKLTAISADISQLLAVHENRISHQERIQTELQKSLEKRKDEADHRLQTVNDQFITMADAFRVAINNQKDEVFKKMDESAKTRDIQHDEMKKRMNTLERWMLMAIGGGSVVIFIIERFF